MKETLTDFAVLLFFSAVATSTAVLIVNRGWMLWHDWKYSREAKHGDATNED